MKLEKRAKVCQSNENLCIEMDKNDKPMTCNEQIIYHSSPKLSNLSLFPKENSQVYLSSESSSDSLELLSSIVPSQQVKESSPKKTTLVGEESYFWSKLKESGAILDQLIQYHQDDGPQVFMDVEEDTSTSDVSLGNQWDWDSFDEWKPFLMFSNSHRVGEFQVSQDSPNWDKLLVLLKSTFPIGCFKFMIDNNLLSASVIRNCFKLLCCPFCNPNLAHDIDMSKLCDCLLYLLDRRISFTGKVSLSTIPIWKDMPEWIPTWQDFEKWLSHMKTMTDTDNILRPERIQKPTWSVISTWKRILNLMGTCVAFVTCGRFGTMEDITKVVHIMTRILLDPFGRLLKKEACWVLHRCWILFGGGCEQLTCWINEYFVCIFLKYATSIVLQHKLLESLDSSLEQVSQYFAYKLFVLYTTGEENVFYSINEKIQHQVGEFLVSFLKQHLVYGADIKLLNSRVATNGQFQKFVYPMVFEMKDSSPILHRVDLLDSRWQFCENTWSQHEATSFHLKQVEPETIAKYHWKSGFEPREYVGFMEQLCQRIHNSSEWNCSILIRFALLAIQPRLLFQMESSLKERLVYAISVLKSASAGCMNMNSTKIAVSLGHLHMIAECLSHSVETTHSGVFREEQLTLRHWFGREEES